MAAIKKVPCHITVAGRLDDYRFHICKDIASGLADRFGQVTFDAEGMTEVDWNAYIELKRKEFKKNGSKHRTSPVIFYNSINYIGDEEQFRTWCFRAYGHKANKSNNVLYRGLAKKEYSSWLMENKNSFCYFDLQRGGQQLGRVVFELYRTVCPRTCQNFMDLCTGSRGKGYKNTILHRVIPDVFLQGGDIDGGSGDGGGSAATGGTFPDENFAIRHDRPGILAMANDGTAHTNGSQFYVTLRPMPWLDTKRVSFGRVISGMRAVKLASRVKTLNQRPLQDEELQIVNCGEYFGSHTNSKSGATVTEVVTGDATQFAQVKEIFTIASSGSKRMRPEELMVALKASSGPLATKFGRLAPTVVNAIESHVVKTRVKSVTIDVFVSVVMAAINNAPALPAAPAKAAVSFGQLNSDAMSSIAEVFVAMQPNDNGMVSVIALEKIAASSSPALTPLAHFQEQQVSNVTEVQEYFNALLSRDENAYNKTLLSFRKQLGLQ